MSSKLESMHYRIETRRVPDGVLVCIPTLGEKLFRAIGDTEDEAREILGSMVDDLMSWMAERNKPIPPPGPEDIKAMIAKFVTEKPENKNLGLLSIIRS